MNFRSVLPLTLSEGVKKLGVCASARTDSRFGEVLERGSSDVMDTVGMK